MEAKHPDAGELIYEETSAAISNARWLIVTLLAGLGTGGLLAVALVPLFSSSTEGFTVTAVLLIIFLVLVVIGVHTIRTLRPLRIYERGLITRSGIYVPFERLNRAYMSVMRPPYGCRVWFSNSLSKGPMVNLHLKQDEVDAYRHMELARKLEDLGFVISAAKHPKAEDDGLVEMTRGALLLEEPADVFAAWRKRSLIVYELVLLLPLLLMIPPLVFLDLELDGNVGPVTTVVAPLILAFSALLAILVFLALPRARWRIYEKGVAPRALSYLRSYVRYEDCAYVVLRRPRLFGTGSLRVYLKGWGIAGDIPVGQKKHAYGDIDRLVELLESKGVHVER